MVGLPVRSDRLRARVDSEELGASVQIDLGEVDHLCCPLRVVPAEEVVVFGGKLIAGVP